MQERYLFILFTLLLFLLLLQIDACSIYFIRSTHQGVLEIWFFIYRSGNPPFWCSWIMDLWVSCTYNYAVYVLIYLSWTICNMSWHGAGLTAVKRWCNKLCLNSYILCKNWVICLLAQTPPYHLVFIESVLCLYVLMPFIYIVINVFIIFWSGNFCQCNTTILDMHDLGLNNCIYVHTRRSMYVSQIWLYIYKCLCH